jgi:hypothetical protein
MVGVVNGVERGKAGGAESAASKKGENAEVTKVVRVLKNLWRWFRREVRDPAGRHLKRIGKEMERAAREWGTTLDEDLAELTSVIALAGALWAQGNREAARQLWKQTERYAKSRRDALLNALFSVFSVTPEGGALK